MTDDQLKEVASKLLRKEKEIKNGRGDVIVSLEENELKFHNNNNETPF